MVWLGGALSLSLSLSSVLGRRRSGGAAILARSAARARVASDAGGRRRDSVGIPCLCMCRACIRCACCVPIQCACCVPRAYVLLLQVGELGGRPAPLRAQHDALVTVRCCALAVPPPAATARCCAPPLRAPRTWCSGACAVVPPPCRVPLRSRPCARCSFPLRSLFLAVAPSQPLVAAPPLR